MSNKRRIIINPYDDEAEAFYEQFAGWLDINGSNYFKLLQDFIDDYPPIKDEYDRLKEDPLFITHVYFKICDKRSQIVKSLTESKRWRRLTPREKALTIAYQYLEDKDGFQVGRVSKDVYEEVSVNFKKWLTTNFRDIDMELFKDNLIRLDGRLLNPRNLFNRELGR